MNYFDKLDKVQSSPASRVSVARTELNFSTLEHDTIYTVVLRNTRGKVIFHKIRAVTLSMMLPKVTYHA